MRANARRRARGVRVVEERAEAADALARVGRGPELLEGRRQLEAELGLVRAQRPVERAAEIVLLLERHVQPLAAGREITGVQVRRSRHLEEELGVAAVEALRLGALVQQLPRVL